MGQGEKEEMGSVEKRRSWIQGEKEEMVSGRKGEGRERWRKWVQGRE